MTIPPASPGFTAPLAIVAPWMAGQRWFANKGALPEIEEIGSWRLPSADDTALITHLLLDHTKGKPALYQVPLAYRREASSGMLVGEHDGWYLYDAPHDQEYTSALLAMVTGEREAIGDDIHATGHRAGEAVAPGSGLVSKVLTGEQSNTSIIFERPDGTGTPVILKLFRALHDGENPDVVLQTALAAAGSREVPMPVGNIVGQWRDRGQPSGRATGHLAFAQEFLPGSVDAWRVALAAAEHGDDFTTQARELGVATADVHALLASELPTRAPDSVDIDAVIAQMHGRLTAAIREVPALAAFRDSISDVFSRAAGATWPAQQRIHGDLHLGQVLAAPSRGWVFVDFEGEPLRPMRERSVLDSPMRDVAGMLRSFDYVAGSLAMSGSSAPAGDWVAAARVAFTDGYSEASGCDLRDNRALIDAFEIDKALYETVYEVRNRPDWLPIPLAAIERLSVRAAHL